jgi:2-phospho-L-lactate guanylyltransferase
VFHGLPSDDVTLLRGGAAGSVVAERLDRVQPLLQWVLVRLAVLIPVKRFSAAKGRLAGVLSDHDRAELARWMATRVVDVVAELPTFVACDDEGVAAWATERGTEVIWGAGLGLNGAVDDGVRRITALGFDQVVVSHADLARPGRLLDVVDAGAITLVPDRRHDGTNVMSFPTATPLAASYGGGSFGRHLEQALAFDGITVEVRSDPDLSLDLDTGRDLSHPLIREVLPPWLRTNQANPRP